MKKVFISYSWGTKEHQDWVVSLGTRLMSDTVDVILDRWSLRDGHDIHSFMEEMVKADDIFRVLIICDSNYKDKANGRKGGVGTETQIITPEIYNNQKQEKFIPIVVERDESDKVCLPIYLSSRKYIDFSKDEFFEDSYEELLRNILEAPSIPKPKLGEKAPHYITDSSVNLSEINSKLKTLESQIKKYPDKINIYASDFLETFLERLWDFQFSCKENSIVEYGDALYKNLLSYKELKSSFITFILLISQLDKNFDVDELIAFFEKQPLYLKSKENVGNYYSGDFDNYKIIFHELFICTISASLKNKNYDLVKELLHSRYHIKDEYYNHTQKPSRFTFLYKYHENLEKYVEQKYRRISGFGYYLVTNLDERIPKDLLITADTLCYVIYNLFDKDSRMERWFPFSFIHKDSRYIDFFTKLDSARYFEKIKGIFDVEKPTELIDIINKYEQTVKDSQRAYFGNGFESLPFVHELIDKEKLAIYR